MALAPGGRFVYSLSGSQFDLIDTQSNQKHLEHRVDDGHVRGLTPVADKNLIALTSKALLVIDADTGAISRLIDGFDEPYLLVERRR